MEAAKGTEKETCTDGVKGETERKTDRNGAGDRQRERER